MKFRIVHGVDAAQLRTLLPPPLQRRVPPEVLKGGPYTVVIFPLNHDPVKAGPASKAVARRVMRWCVLSVPVTASLRGLVRRMCEPMGHLIPSVSSVDGSVLT